MHYMRYERCVGAIARDPAGRLLVVQRAHPPGEGLWTLPGGRVEPGESDAQALVRELAEETSLRVSVGALIGSVERPGPAGVRFDIHDYAVTVTGGELDAGDDAAAARWVSESALLTLPTTPGLIDALVAWGILPANDR